MTHNWVFHGPYEDDPGGCATQTDPDDCPLGDYGLIRIAGDSPYEATNQPGNRSWVYVLAGATERFERKTRRNPTYRIDRARRQKKNWVFCRTGGVSGTSCGQVKKLGVKKNYVGPGSAGGLSRMKALKCDKNGRHGSLGIYTGHNEPGDSGGPIFKKNAVFGVNSGKLLENHCIWYTAGAREIEETMNVTVGG